MTMAGTHNLNCPKCGNNQDVPIWESINIELNPELRDKLFQAKINVFACSKCGETTMLGTPLLYHDMDKEYCVQYYPSEEIFNDAFLKQFTKNGYLRYAENITEMINNTKSLYIAQPHIVFNMAELILYVMFREGILRND